MTRPKFRRSLRFENLETRQLMSAGGPTAQEQYMLELINQARTNPQAAAQQVTSNLTPDVVATLNYYGTDVNAAKQAIATASPKPPLAWNADLAAAAQGHSQDMANTQVQSHTGSDGSSPVNISRHLSRDAFPTWTPDGRGVTFVSNREGGSDIFTQPVEPLVR